MLKRNFSIKKLAFFILVIVFLWIAVSYFGQTKHILAVLIAGKWYWITLAVLAQIIFYPFYAFFVEYVFKIFKVAFCRRQILPIYLASKFTDVALPIATVGKVAIFVRNGKKHDITPISVGIGMSFTILLEIGSFTTLSLVILYLMYFFGEPRQYLLVTLAILAVFVIAATLMIVKTAKSDKPFSKTSVWIIKKVAKLAGQRSINMYEVRGIFNEISRDLSEGGKRIWTAFGFGILVHFIYILTLAFIYLAFANNFSVLAILATYVAGLLFTIVSITPQGVGVAETIMITTLHSFGVDISVAAVITLAYRGLLYWLPLFPGFYYFSHLELKQPDKSSPITAID